MTPDQIRQEVSNLKRQLADLDSAIAERTSALSRELRSEFFNELDVTAIRRAKAEAERRAQFVRERIEALTSQLPDEQQLEAAAAEAQIAVTNLESANRRVSD